MKSHRLIAAIVCIVAATTNFDSLAQGGTVGVAVVANLTGRELIRQASEAASRAISHANEVGNGLLARAGSELSVAARNADLILGANIDKATGNLHRQQQDLMGQLSLLTQQLNGMQDVAFELKDTAVIDLAQWKSSIPFSRSPYFIQKVEGVAHVISDADYRMRVFAYGITPRRASR